MPFEQDIGKAYKTYYTHQALSDSPETLARWVYRCIQENYLASRYGYQLPRRWIHGSLLGALMYLYPGGRARTDFSVFYLASQPRGRLLDIGCGGGAMLRRMHELGWHVEGVDSDGEAVRIARAKGLKVYLGSIEEQKFSQESFDALIMSHVIEHVADPIGLLRECYRILKPGGHAVVVTPNARSWGHRLYAANWRGLEPPRHLHIFAVGPLKAALRAAGFHKVRVSTTIRDTNAAFIASRSLQRSSGYDMHARQPLITRAWGYAMQAMEWVLLGLDREAGEEIAVVAQK
jgi:2-polyprenyl-3-methyl-5-hydroxy-6-metoxy-1,4-benzoquinol methylase